MAQTTSVYEDLEIRLRDLEQDIAEAKKMVKSRPKNDSFFEALINAAPVGIARVTQSGHILYVNQSLSDAFGYRSPQQLIGSVQNFTELYVLPEQGRNHLDLFLKPENHADGFDAKVKGANGEARWLRIFVRTVPSPEERLVHEVFTTDITERRLARESLFASEKRFRMLVEQAGDGFFLHDLEGRILDVNRHACESLGYTRDELLTKNISEIAPKVFNCC